jgi:pimeloyl-ACP methyl ester carboxylesterase
MKILQCVFFVFLLVGSAFSQTITFPSKDGLLITADLYEKDTTFIYILLCHQAGYSRGEYIETAQRLLQEGYNCLAIDQRSGKEANKILNETAKRAKEKDTGTDYKDAEQDILASIEWLYKKNGGKKIIVLGSSYSASLVLKIANKNEMVEKVVAFSPGEYIRGTSITLSSRDMDKPAFITSSRSEAESVKEIAKAIPTANLTLFIPESEGIHGSRALWKSNPNSEEYWNALLPFLKK